MYKLMHSVRAYKVIFAILEHRWLIQKNGYSFYK